MNAHEYAVKANGSFALPDACFKVKALMEDEASVIEDFANVISIDPSMTSRLLQIANSAIYSFRGQVSTISRAITIIGTQSLYNMMVVDIAASAFKHFGNQAIDLKRFWRMSVYTGLACKNLAIKANIRDIERLFVAGLLQNFGELIVAKSNPKIAKACEKYNERHLPWLLQKHYLGFTYTEITTEMLSLWEIPEKIVMPIRHYHEAKTIDINKDVKVLYIASRLALIDSHPEVFSFEKLLDDKLCQSLSITQDDLIAASEFASSEAENILAVMNAKFF